MADEFFYGATLKAGESVTWDPEIKDDYPCNFKLIIRQILLGVEAKSDDYHVVQVETMSQRDAIKIPIAVLRKGETRYVACDLEFPDAPVTFKLIEGSGPVHIHGQHLPGTLLEEIEEYGDEMEEELVEEEEAEDDDAEDVPKKKPKLEQQPIKGNAKPKPAAAAAAANNKTVKKSENQK